MARVSVSLTGNEVTNESNLGFPRLEVLPNKTKGEREKIMFYLAASRHLNGVAASHDGRS
jgi:hypothetical protein